MIGTNSFSMSLSIVISSSIFITSFITSLPPPPPGIFPPLPPPFPSTIQFSLPSSPPLWRSTPPSLLRHILRYLLLLPPLPKSLSYFSLFCSLSLPPLFHFSSSPPPLPLNLCPFPPSSASTPQSPCLSPSYPLSSYISLSHNNPCFQCNIAIKNFFSSPEHEVLRVSYVIVLYPSCVVCSQHFSLFTL